MTDKEHELDRIARKLDWSVEPYKGYYGLWADGILTAPFIFAESKDAILKSLREVIGPDPALTQRIAELEKEVEAARREGFEAAKERVIDHKHVGAMTYGGPVTKEPYPDWDDD